MSKSGPPVETVKASEARQHWSRLLNRVFRHEARILIEKSGIPVAAVISARDLEWLKRFEARRAERFKILDQISDKFENVPDDEIEREVARAIAEVRAENRRRKQVAAHTP